MKTPTLDEYIDAQVQKLTPDDLARLVRFRDRLARKSEEVDPELYPRLRPQILAILQILDVPEVEQPSQVQLELGVAASYFLKRYDLIPDEIPGIGLKDDEWVSDRVFLRNRAEVESLLQATMSQEEIEALFP